MKKIRMDRTIISFRTRLLHPWDTFFSKSMEILIVLFILVITLWLIWRWQVTSTFQKLGIPGPKPNILFGNLLELYWKGPLKCHDQWVKKYGRVVGFYLGMKPALLIADPLILKNIFIKDFAKFMNRELFNPIGKYDPHDKLGQSVLNLPGEAWKNVRSILTPTFTASKMKQMSSSMHSAIDLMMKILSDFENKKGEFDIFDVFQRMTLDIICRTAFGIRLDIQTNAKSQAMAATRLLFESPYKNPVIFIGQCFPLLRKVCIKITSILLAAKFRGRNPARVLREGIIQVLKIRRENKQGKTSDLLQIMIDSAVSESGADVDVSNLEAGNAENELNAQKQEKIAKSMRKMSDDEIISSAFTVLLAGYETTSNTLAYTTYFLAKYPNIQEKLFEEIDSLFQNNKKIEYATVNKLTYLDKVLSESLRMMPPVYLFTNRYALTDVEYEDIKIPKGMLIRAPTYLIHHDPDLWEDPEKFDPERFEEKPNTDGIKYFPFGVGPRNCLGMRFAQLESKLVLAYLVYHFRIHLADVQKDNLPISIRLRTLTPANGVLVRLEKRNEIEIQS